MSKLLEFLFGAKPEIFDKNGAVRHKIPEHRWESWKKRYSEGEEYNWRNHTGTKAGKSSRRTQ